MSARRPRLDPVTPVVEALLQAGLVPDGATATEEVRVSTSRSPVFGRIGGEVRTFGGRARYQKPGTNLRVTVGPRTVCVYLSGRDVVSLAHYETRSINLDELRKVLTEGWPTPAPARESRDSDRG